MRSWSPALPPVSAMTRSMVQVPSAVRLSYVVFAPDAMAEAAAMVAALMSEKCARIWSAFR
jgi:hypothetical protein